MTHARLSVSITVLSKDCGAGHRGYDLANSPVDGEILERIDRWWRLGRLIKQWSADAAQSPGLERFAQAHRRQEGGEPPRPVGRGQQVMVRTPAGCSASSSPLRVSTAIAGHQPSPNSASRCASGLAPRVGCTALRMADAACPKHRPNRTGNASLSGKRQTCSRAVRRSVKKWASSVRSVSAVMASPQTLVQSPPVLRILIC
jgi:hypothetical protein